MLLRIYTSVFSNNDWSKELVEKNPQKVIYTAHKIQYLMI